MPGANGCAVSARAASDSSPKPARRAACSPRRTPAASGSAASGADTPWPRGGALDTPRAASWRRDNHPPDPSAASRRDKSGRDARYPGLPWRQEPQLPAAFGVERVLRVTDGLQSKAEGCPQQATAAAGPCPRRQPAFADADPRPAAPASSGSKTAPAQRPPNHCCKARGARQAAGQAGAQRAAGQAGPGQARHESGRPTGRIRSICPAPRRPRSSTNNASCAAAGM